jgi:predicted outer membrane protein
MKLTPLLLSTFAISAALHAKDPVKSDGTRSSLPGKYPPIIHLDPVAPGSPEPGLFHSEMGGREVQFLKNASRIGADQLALAELAKGRGGSEQIKAIAETLGSTQATESKEIARLAASKKVTLPPASASTVKRDFEKLEGAKFEKAWVERLISVSEEGVQAYESGAKTTDADIRSFGEKLLPIARVRLQLANRLGGRSVAPAAPTPVPLRAQPPVTTTPVPAKPGAASVPSAIAPPVDAPATPPRK